MRAGIVRATGLTLSDLSTSMRFLAQVPAFLHRPFSDAEARAIVRERMAGREATFLDFVRRAIYEQAGSPYLEDPSRPPSASPAPGTTARTLHP